MEVHLAPPLLLMIIYSLLTYSYPLDNSLPDVTSFGSVENITVRSRFQIQFLPVQNITSNCRILSNNYDNLPWANKYEQISFDFYMLCERILIGIFTPLVCIFGLAANTLNCIVFYKHGLRHRINFLLFSHSCTDLAYVFYLLVFFSERLYLQMIGQYNKYGPVMTFLTNTGLHTFMAFTYASDFLSTLIAAERYLCIVKPFTVNWLLKTKNMCVIVSVATIILVSAHYVATERYKMVCVYDAELDTTVYIYFPSDFYVRNSLVINIFTGALYGLGLPSVYISVTVFTTIITTVHLRHAAEWRQGAGTGQIILKEIALTKMFIATSCMFLVFKSPEIVMKATPLVIKGFRVGGVFHNSFMTLVAALMLTSSMNSSLNIIVYLKMGSKFRSTIKHLCKQHDEINRTSSFVGKHYHLAQMNCLK